MSPSLEEDATSNATGAPAQSPEPLPHSNHHDPIPDHSSSSTEVRSKRVPPRRGSVDKDAQDLVISSLRSQVQDLVSQVTELNNKLVKSYDRVSDLEDDLHVTSSSLRSSSVKISQLELERSQHLSALNTGLLVEKSHVTSELTRLMEKATEEAARRGQAESAQAAIEKDLDDVSAALFDQANTMVAEARLERARSDRKAEDAERSLREAEDAVRLMQQQLQSLQGEKETAERRMDVMNAAMGKGKWIERASSLPANTHLLLTSHVSYHEFLSFISHLRALRASYPQPPSIHSLLALPFAARLQLEDTDPTLRLDMASALNWLSRRSIIAAIQTGQLTIEPIATQTILASAASPQPPLAVNVVHGSNGSNVLSCGLCGHGIVPNTEQLTPTRTGYLPRPNATHFNTWSSSIFRKSSVPSSPSGPPSPPPYHDASSLPAQIYIFRLSEPAPAFPSALPLCTSGWCLTRLRATCTLWSFLRTNILEKIWEEEVQPPPAPPPHRELVSASIDKPPIPPRRKTKSSGFWGVASSFGLDRVPGWSEGDKDKRAEQEPEKRRFVAPPRRIASPQPTTLTPPPLPIRNRSRPRTPAVEENGVGRRPSSGTASSSEDSQSPSSNRQRTPVSVKPESSPTLSSLLVASSEDTETLDDGFVTPSDEITPATIASISPESSAPPQPESSHNTPVTTTAPLPEDTDNAQIESEAPSAAAQPEAPPEPEPKPAEVVLVQKEEPNAKDAVARHDPPPTGVVQFTSPPTRTGSPAPPPVPRRAAARRAVPPPPPARSASPALAPAPEVSVVKVAEPNGHVKPEARADPDTAPNSDPSPEPSKENGIEGAVPPPTEAAEAAPPKGEAETEAEVVEAVADAEPDNNKSETEEKQQLKLQLQAGVDHSAGPAVESPADLEQMSSPQTVTDETELERTKEAAEEKAVVKARHPPPPPPRHPGPVRPASTQSVSLEKSAHSPGKFDKPEEPGFAPDGTPYVGDGTWEERTWKELTRLREDAFWARVGRAQ
ncbi:hypothetical protein EI94DRAFT_1722624 [Lactarius quietus]|nr:hypothetical protein EI94DRAFT_1722624 [Lactarius quietus]